MIIERFLNAALFFAEKTAAFDTIKLYKLLFLADRDCMKKTGHTITEATYRKIQPWGPVPVEAKALVDGMAAGDEITPPLSGYLKVKKKGNKTDINLSGAADLNYFSGEEVAILEKLAEKYKHYSGKNIAHAVHNMRGVKELDWGKDFHMEVFLPAKDREASREARAVAHRFKLSLMHG